MKPHIIVCWYCNYITFVNLVGYSRGGYNQNRWGSNYRDSGPDSRSGYNRSQPSGGSYNRPPHYSKGGYNQVIPNVTVWHLVV